MRKIIFISIMSLLLLTQAAYTQSGTQNPDHSWTKVADEEKKGGYHLISPDELKDEYLKDASAFLLVDTRQEWSYQMQHIKSAAHIDFTPTWWNQYSPMMRSEMKRILGPDKDKKIVFY